MKKYESRDSDLRSDEDLCMAWCQNQDHNAFDDLQKRKYDDTVKYARNRIHRNDPIDEAEWIANSFWIKLYEKRHYDKTRGSFKIFYQISISSEVKNHGRKLKSKESLSLDDPDSPQPTSLISAKNITEEYLILREVRDSLTPSERFTFDQLLQNVAQKESDQIPIVSDSEQRKRESRSRKRESRLRKAMRNFFNL